MSADFFTWKIGKDDQKVNVQYGVTITVVPMLGGGVLTTRKWHFEVPLSEAIELRDELNKLLPREGAVAGPCVCSLNDLMIRGCKCGGLKK